MQLKKIMQGVTVFVRLVEIEANDVTLEAASFDPGVMRLSPEVAEAEWRGLGAALRANTTLKRFSVSGRTLGGERLDAVAEGLMGNTKLRSLEISEACLRPPDLIRLAQALESNTSLTSLSLRDSDILGFPREFLDMLAVNRSLLELDLQNNQLTSEGLIDLADALKANDFLEVLDLSATFIDPEATGRLGEFLKVHQKLKCLWFQECELEEAAVIPIVSALRLNSSLTELNLSSCRMGSVAVAKLADALQVNCTLQKLTLFGSMHRQEDMMTLAGALVQNASITQIGLPHFYPGQHFLRRNLKLVDCVRSTALMLIGVRNRGTDEADGGYFAWLPHEVVAKIARLVWATCGQSEWIEALSHVPEYQEPPRAQAFGGTGRRKGVYMRKH